MFLGFQHLFYNIYMSTARKFIFLISLLLVASASYLIFKVNCGFSFTDPNSLTIESLRNRKYAGSDISIEEILPSENEYDRYITSYYSEGLKIYALLFVPNTDMPENGFPVIILNHGYIIPKLYTPEGNYLSYADSLARAGYIVFKPSYRGHGNSEGLPTSAYFAPDYIIDDLNAIASIKKYPDADSDKIGIWGHSMGGNISLKVAEVSNDVKAVSLWSGVVGSIEDIVYKWQDETSYKPDVLDLKLRNENKATLVRKYGKPSEDSDYWISIDPVFHLGDINVPVQLQTGLSDTQVVNKWVENPHWQAFCGYD